MSAAAQQSINQDQKPQIQLRARTERIDLSKLSAIVKLPEVDSELISAQGERLSRRVHLQESIDREAAKSATVTQSKKKKIKLQSTSKKTSIRAQALQKKKQPSKEKCIMATSEKTVLTQKSEISTRANSIAAQKTKPYTIVSTKTPSKDILAYSNAIRKSIYIALSLPQAVASRTASSLAPQRFTQAVQEGLKFLATSAAIFLVTIGLLNAPAYYQIAASIFHSEENAEITEDLVAVLAEESRIVSKRAPLLPVAGIERQITQKIHSFISVTPPALSPRLIIPAIQKNVPIVTNVGVAELDNEDWKGLEESIQEGLRHGVVHYPRTASPEEEGNFFLTGHSSYYLWDSGRYKDVFARLGDLKIGDEYYIYFNQKKFTYRIYGEKIVEEDDTSILQQPQGKKMGTLMTCWPPGTTLKRKALFSELVE